MGQNLRMQVKSNMFGVKNIIMERAQKKYFALIFEGIIVH